MTGTTPHYVAMTGTAPQVGAALGTSIHSYGSQSSIFEYAPAGGMSVPASLGDDVSTVTGLDRSAGQSAAAAIQRTAGAHPNTAGRDPAPGAAGGFTCSAWWGQHVSADPAGRRPDQCAGRGVRLHPPAASLGLRHRAASGQGATIAVVLDGSLATMAADANRFFAAQHVPGLAAGQFTVNTGPGFAASCDGDADVPEEPLDVETAHIIAPAAKIVYVAADCTAATLGDNSQKGCWTPRPASSTSIWLTWPPSLTVSWKTQFSPATAAAWTQVFEQGTAEGIGFDFDSGDGGDLAGQGAGGGTRSPSPPRTRGPPRSAARPCRSVQAGAADR